MCAKKAVSISQLSAGMMVVEYLLSHPKCTVREIADYIGLSDSTIRGYLMDIQDFYRWEYDEVDSLGRGKKGSHIRLIMTNHSPLPLNRGDMQLIDDILAGKPMTDKMKTHLEIVSWKIHRLVHAEINTTTGAQKSSELNERLTDLKMQMIRNVMKLDELSMQDLALFDGTISDAVNGDYASAFVFNNVESLMSCKECRKHFGNCLCEEEEKKEREREVQKSRELFLLRSLLDTEIPICQKRFMDYYKVSRTPRKS